MVDLAAWVDRAACRDADPELFFPANWDHKSVKVALDVCDRCPVTDRCLLFAIDQNLDFGIFGGLPPEARRRYRRNNGLKAHTERRFLADHGSEGAYRRHIRNGEKPCDRCQDGYRAIQVEKREKAMGKTAEQDERQSA